jgi:conjugal transfer pilus assembly protein TraV
MSGPENILHLHEPHSDKQGQSLMKRALILAMGLAAASQLFGCGKSSTERDFLCPAQTGSPCTTISDADGANVGGGHSVRERGEDSLADGLSQEPLHVGKAGSQAAAAGTGDGGFAYEAGAYRLPEKVGTVWIAPHSEGGALYEATYVHFLILPAAWGEIP